jgi:uncharacterized protein YkwD
MHGLNKRFATLAVGLAVAIGASACAPSVAQGVPACAAPAAAVDPVSVAVFNRVNGDRAALGLGGLAWNAQLYCLAADWSFQMAATGWLHHRDLNAVIHSAEYSGYHTIGENILRGGAGLTGDQMEDAWMASPGHRANVVNPAFSSIGIALALSPDGEKIYATQNFGGG